MVRSWSRYRAVRASLLALALLLAACGTALGQTDEIQVYDASIAPPGVFNLTLHNNYTPSGGAVPAFPGAIVPEHSLNGVPEWAYGVSPWMEVGLYLPLYSVEGGGAVRVNGFKLRALFVRPHAADQRFFYGINFEFSYNAPHWDPHRYSSEIRPIVGWHIGRIDLVLNPILDNAYEGLGRLDFAPATRLAWHASRIWTVAAEEYDDFGALDHLRGGGAQTHQLFAVLDYGGRVWVETGLGFGLTPATDHRVVKFMVAWDLN
jgi:predicted small secreted protein